MQDVLDAPDRHPVHSSVQGCRNGLVWISLNDAAHDQRGPEGPGEADAGAGSPPVNGTRSTAPFPAGGRQAVFGMGCFWGAERKFWQTPGVYTTAVGYAGGHTPNPTYEEVCSGRTGHTEVVLVVFDPGALSYAELLQAVLGKPRSHPGDAAGQ